MEVNNYTNEIQTSAFAYAGFGLVQEDQVVFGEIIKTLVDQLNEYDAFNPYVASRNADVILYRLFDQAKCLAELLQLQRSSQVPPRPVAPASDSKSGGIQH